MNVVAITLGQVIAYGIGAGFEKMHGGWRWMVGLGAVPAGIQLVFLLFLPESRTCIRLSDSFSPWLTLLNISPYHVVERRSSCRSEDHDQDLCSCQAG